MKHPNVDIRYVNDTKHSIHVYDSEFSISIMVDANELNLILGMTMDRFNSMKEALLGVPLVVQPSNLSSAKFDEKVEKENVRA